jgi:aconitate hydratase
MTFFGKDTLGVKRTLKLSNKEYDYFSIKEAEKKLGTDLSRMPFSLKIILENLLRFEDAKVVKIDDIKELIKWIKNKKSDHEISFKPARVLMQDFTGVPAVVDLAAMRDAMANLGGDPKKINPLTPVDLIIDHSVQVDAYAKDSAFKTNVEMEMKRNIERYQFLRWGQEAFDNFKVVPPGTGICHQVNLEYIAKVVWSRDDEGRTIIFPDTLVGTDSHTTMVNGLAVLGWGVGGIEAEAVMLGQFISMVIPEVVGVRLVGKLTEGVTATDLVLIVTNMLRAKGVVNKFVEFFGPGIENLKLADRATIANMAPEYGATCGLFPIDNEVLRYLTLTGRDQETLKLVEEYAKIQGMWHDKDSIEAEYSDILDIDLSKIEPTLAGPKRPQDKVLLKDLSSQFMQELPTMADQGVKVDCSLRYEVKDTNFTLGHGDVVIAAITSCTNTSNPSVMVGAGLMAKNAIKKGLNIKPWVKTSLAPGSKVVSEYLERSGLQEYLDLLGFNLVGYGCTTCIGNSGPLKSNIEESIINNNLVVASVLSGNRNFEGRIHSLVKPNYLASPMLVVAYAIAGTVINNLYDTPLGQDQNGKDVYLKDIWPSDKEIDDIIHSNLNSDMFKDKYSDVFTGDEEWQKINIEKSLRYKWEPSTYIANPPYFDNMTKQPGKIVDIKRAKMLAKFGDSITTDHISPAGNISLKSPAAKFLIDNGVSPEDFNSYGSRRGNHDVMMRGTFANIRIKNELVPGTEGGVTKYFPTNEVMSIYDAAMKYKSTNTQLIIMAGKEYGTGSSRDWAAKGTFLLGVKAVIAESFERIHRSNLVRMGVLPLTFKDGVNRNNIDLDGSEEFDIIGFEKGITPRMDLKCIIYRGNSLVKEIDLLCRIDTLDEVDFIMHGGILQYVIRAMI